MSKNQYAFHFETGDGGRDTAVLIDMVNGAAYTLEFVPVSVRNLPHARLRAASFGATQSTGVTFNNQMAIGIWHDIARTVAQNGSVNIGVAMQKFAKERTDEANDTES